MLKKILFFLFFLFLMYPCAYGLRFIPETQKEYSKHIDNTPKRIHSNQRQNVVVHKKEKIYATNSTDGTCKFKIMSR